jgi:biopolymer transport protein ExbB
MPTLGRGLQYPISLSMTGSGYYGATWPRWDPETVKLTGIYHTDLLLGRSMNMSISRATLAIIPALAMLMLAVPAPAQQGMAPAAPSAPVIQQAPVASQAPAALAPVAQTVEAAQPAQATPSADATATPGERDKLLKAAAAQLHDLSPWSMFMSADVLVKAVMIGLAFASLVTWTIFIAKMIEFAVIQRKLRSALAKIADARSLAEAQFALGAKGSVLA